MLALCWPVQRYAMRPRCPPGDNFIYVISETVADHVSPRNIEIENSRIYYSTKTLEVLAIYISNHYLLAVKCITVNNSVQFS